jgi:hypothetical protein
MLPARGCAMLNESVYREGCIWIVGKTRDDLCFFSRLLPLSSPIPASMQYDQSVGKEALSRTYHTAPTGIAAKAFSFSEIAKPYGEGHG